MPYKPHKLVRDKIAKKQEKQQFWRVFLFESVLFLTTSLLAVFNASKLQELFGAQKIYNSGPSFLGFLLSFLIVTVIVVLIVY